jgi:hypothetical protein
MTTSPTIEEQTSNKRTIEQLQAAHDKQQRKPLTAHIEEHDKKKSKEEQRKPLTAHIEEHDKKKSNIGLFKCLRRSRVCLSQRRVKKIV